MATDAAPFVRCEVKIINGRAELMMLSKCLMGFVFALWLHFQILQLNSPARAFLVRSSKYNTDAGRALAPHQSVQRSRVGSRINLFNEAYHLIFTGINI